MKIKRKSALIMALVVMVGTTAAYVSRTYAKYTASVTASGTATVARWAFASENSTQTVTVDVSSTVEAGTLASSRVAPGTSGSFNAVLTNENSDVAVDYTISLTDITNVPTNMHFYSDSACTQLLDNSGTITGTLEANDATGVTKTIYWKWIYEGNGASSGAGVTSNDASDTANGEAAASDRAIEVTMTIDGVQHNPTSSIPA